jgi:hypothetical protein
MFRTHFDAHLALRAGPLAQRLLHQTSDICSYLSKLCKDPHTELANLANLSHIVSGVAQSTSINEIEHLQFCLICFLGMIQRGNAFMKQRLLYKVGDGTWSLSTSCRVLT